MANIYSRYGIVIPYPSPPSFAGAPTHIGPARPPPPSPHRFYSSFFFSPVRD